MVIQTLMFFAGMNTLRQSFLGTRLPAVTGRSYTFVLLTISIILGGCSANEPNSHIKFLGIMRGTHGALIVASTLQIIVVFSDLWCNVARYLSSLLAAPLVALVVFGLYELEIPKAGKRKALSVDAVIVFGSQRIPQVIHSVMWIMFILFRGIKCLQFSWDPGGSNVTHRLEGKPHFKNGGMLGIASPIAHGPTQLSDGLCYKGVRKQSSRDDSEQIPWLLCFFFPSVFLLYPDPHFMCF